MLGILELVWVLKEIAIGLTDLRLFDLNSDRGILTKLLPISVNLSEKFSLTRLLYCPYCVNFHSKIRNTRNNACRIIVWLGEVLKQKLHRKL